MPSDAAKRDTDDQRHLWVIGGVALWTSIYYAVFDPLGYLLSTSVYLFALTMYFNKGKWLANALTSVLFALGTYVPFMKILGVTLAKGLVYF